MSDVFKVGGTEVAVTNGSAYGTGVNTAEGPKGPLSYAVQVLKPVGFRYDVSDQQTLGGVMQRLAPDAPPPIKEQGWVRDVDLPVAWRRTSSPRRQRPWPI